VYCESEPERARPPDVAVHDDTTGEVIVMVGLPASGKDTWLASYPGPIVSLDALREELDVDPADGQGGVIAAAREAAREHLRAGRGFAWNATNLGDKLRAGVIALARGYRARVRVVYCEATCAQQEARNRARPSPVPRAAIDRMLDRWTMPALDEAHAVEYVGPEVSRPWWPADTPAAPAADPSTR
jgi:predicted kinase